MFGEESIYGQSIVSLDKKNRILLPKFTSVDKNDSLVIVDSGEYLSLYNESSIDNYLKFYEDKYKDCDYEKRKEVELELYKIYSSIIKKIKCDSQNRINLNGINIEKTEFLCIGAKNYLILDTKRVK